MSTAASVLEKYYAGTPVNVAMSIRNPSNANRDFLLFVSQFHPQTVANVESIPENNVEFFKSALLSLFHIVFVQSEQPMYGSANFQLVKLVRDGETYRVELYGLAQARSVFELNDAYPVFSDDGKSFSLRSNGARGPKTLEFRQLDQTKDFNDFVVTETVTDASTTPTANPVQLYQLTVTEADSLLYRYHLVQYSM